MTCKMLKSAAPSSVVRFGTGYFNPTKEYLDIILNGSKASFDVLVRTSGEFDRQSRFSQPKFMCPSDLFGKAPCQVSSFTDGASPG